MAEKLCQLKKKGGGIDLYDFEVTPSTGSGTSLTKTVDGISAYDYILVQVSSSVIASAANAKSLFVLNKTNSISGTFRMNNNTAQSFTMSRLGDVISITGGLASPQILKVLGSNDGMFSL